MEAGTTAGRALESSQNGFSGLAARIVVRIIGGGGGTGHATRKRRASRILRGPHGIEGGIAVQLFR